MKPRHFIDYQEHRLRRPLSAAELMAVNIARHECSTGKRDTVKAMWAALKLELSERPVSVLLKSIANDLD